MKRSILLYWIIIKSIVKTAAVAVKSLNNVDEFPTLLVLIVVAEVFFGIYVVAKKNITGLKNNLVTMFFAAESLSIIFKLWFVGFQHNVTASMTNMIITGSILDLIINAAILVILLRTRKYILVEKNVEVEEISQ